MSLSFIARIQSLHLHLRSSRFYKTAISFLVLFLASFSSSAEETNVGSVNNNIELRGAIINTGAVLGQPTDNALGIEVSIGSLHSNSEDSIKVTGDINNNILIYGLLGGVSVVNAGIAFQGGLCAKVSVGSVGSSSCSGNTSIFSTGN